MECLDKKMIDYLYSSFIGKTITKESLEEYGFEAIILSKTAVIATYKDDKLVISYHENSPVKYQIILIKDTNAFREDIYFDGNILYFINDEAVLEDEYLKASNLSSDHVRQIKE